MTQVPRNLFQDIPENLTHELVEKLVEHPALRIERIVSRGQASPTGCWYDQDEHEWVMILAGKAELQVEGREPSICLHPGDTYHFPAHMKHRVLWTAPNQDTIWLAVFWKSV